MRGVETKREANNCARRSGAAAVVGCSVIFSIAQRFPRARIGEAAGRSRKAIGAEKKAREKEGKGKREQGFAIVYTPAATSTELLREGYIFLQGKGIVKPAHALWNQRVLVELRITRWVGMV
jgi:hypothetical protein